MYLIIGLSESIKYGKTQNAIIVVMDKLSKICHYIPYRLDITGGKHTEVIKREVISFQKVPQAIISDCGSLFALRLLINLMYFFCIE